MFARTLRILGMCCVFATMPVVEAQMLMAFVSIPPQRLFVKRIGGERVRVEVLLPSGASPETNTPTIAELTRLADAAVYFRIGLPFETPLVPKLESAMPKLRVVDTRRHIALRRYGDDSATDPHIWLDPTLVMIQAMTIYETLADLDPAGEASYFENLLNFDRDLKRLHRRLRARLRPVRGGMLLAFHPAYGYFADAYGLRMEAVATGGIEPSAKTLAHIIDNAQAAGVRTLFVQPQFASKVVEVVADAIGAQVVRLDPLAEDYFANLDRIAAAVVATLGTEGGR